MLRKLAFRLALAPLLVWIPCAAILTWKGTRDRIAPADLALVLGSKVNPDGTPSPRLQSRLDKAVELHGKGVFSRILVSGGIGKEGYDEAAVMADYLVRKGVPRGSILEDNAGNTTYDSALKTAAVCTEQKLRSVLVVSQYFHIPRATLALEKSGIPLVLNAHADFVEWLREPYSITRELAGYVSYHFKNYPVPAARDDSGTPR
jgi:vancomycin permeability regulator SanA